MMFHVSLSGQRISWVNEVRSASTLSVPGLLDVHEALQNNPFQSCKSCIWKDWRVSIGEGYYSDHADQVHACIVARFRGFRSMSVT